MSEETWREPSAVWVESFETLPTWGMTRNGELFERPTPDSLMRARESSFSPLLPTLKAGDHQGSNGPAELRRAQPRITATDAYFPGFEGVVQWSEGETCTTAPEPVESSQRSTRNRLNLKFAEWMLGFREGYVTETKFMTRRDCISVLGNSASPPQAELALRVLLTIKED